MPGPHAPVLGWAWRPLRYVDGEMGEVGPQRQIRTVAWQQGQKCVGEARHPGHYDIFTVPVSSTNYLKRQSHTRGHRWQVLPSGEAALGTQKPHSKAPNQRGAHCAESWFPHSLYVWASRLCGHFLLGSRGCIPEPL